MAYFPVKARSELVMPTNFSDGGVCDMTLRFHDASPASIRPALRPMRGSGFGGAADMLVPVCAPALAASAPNAATAISAVAARLGWKRDVNIACSWLGG